MGAGTTEEEQCDDDNVVVVVVAVVGLRWRRGDEEDGVGVYCCPTNNLYFKIHQFPYCINYPPGRSAFLSVQYILLAFSYQSTFASIGCELSSTAQPLTSWVRMVGVGLVRRQANYWAGRQVHLYCTTFIAYRFRVERFLAVGLHGLVRKAFSSPTRIQHVSGEKLRTRQKVSTILRPQSTHSSGFSV